MRSFIFTFILLIPITSVLNAISEDVKLLTEKEQVKIKLNALNKYYLEHPDYEVKTRHLIFADHTTGTFESQHLGYFRYKGQNEHSMIMGIENIQNGTLRVSIDTATKTVVARSPKKPEKYSYEALGNSLEMCKKVRYKDSASLTTIHMFYDPERFPVNALKLVISNNRIMSLDIWHPEDLDEDENPVSAHTRVEYSGYKENAKYKSNEFRTSHVVRFMGNKLVAVGKYNSYQFYDLRLQE